MISVFKFFKALAGLVIAFQGLHAPQVFIQIRGAKVPRLRHDDGVAFQRFYRQQHKDNGNRQGNIERRRHYWIVDKHKYRGENTGQRHTEQSRQISRHGLLDIDKIIDKIID